VTEAGHGFPSRDLVHLQLGLLELYETLLDNPGWNEGKVNAALKAAMLSAMALLRVQQALGVQLVSAQRDLIREYRAKLEEWLVEQAKSAEGGGAPPPSSTESGPDPVGRGASG
jgi:hypothetical protein